MLFSVDNNVGIINSGLTGGRDNAEVMNPGETEAVSCTKKFGEMVCIPMYGAFQHQ